MADPSFVNIPNGVWTKILTNVTSGIIWKITETEYIYTYRMTGNPAPTLESDGVRIFKDDDESDNQVSLSANAGIDIYLWAKNKDGRVRVDV